MSSGRSSSVYFDRIGPDRVLEGIFVEQGPAIATARTARIGLAPDGQAVIRMEDGAVTTQMPNRTTHAVHFHSFLLAIPMPGQSPVKPQSHRTQLDRYTLTDLLDLPPRARAAGLTPPMATAAASGRVATILFCALMPLLAFALAIPPKRSRSSIGLGLGIGLIVLFWKAAALVEDTAVATAPFFHAALLLVFAAAIVWLLRRQYRLGHGANEAALDRSLGGHRAALSGRGSGGGADGRAFPQADLELPQWRLAAFLPPAALGHPQQPRLRKPPPRHPPRRRSRWPGLAARRASRRALLPPP